MARLPIDLSSVQLAPVFSGSGKVELPPGPAQVESRPVRFQFGPRSKPVVNMTGEVKVQVANDAERKQCAFEFVQLAKPVIFERQYSGQFPDDEATIINWGSHISNRFWLDGHTDDTGSDLVAVRRPFMSRQPHHGDGASGGLFRNTLADHPGIGTPDWILGENLKKHFLLKVNYQAEFITFLVFIHPTKERDPLAMIKWTVEHEIVFQWAVGQLRVRSGVGRIVPGKVTRDASELNKLMTTTQEVSSVLINQVSNPALMQSAGMAPADGKVRWPLRLPLAQDGFFVP